MRFQTWLAGVLGCAALLAPPASASSLTLDGGVAVTKNVGEPLLLSLSGTPGMPQFLLFDLFPGPTQLFGQSLPLGFSPFVTVVGLGVVPPGGTLALPLVTPSIAGLDTLTIHLLGVVADPLAPAGLDFTNGATLSIVTPPTAGIPRSTLVGRKVPLLSTGIANANGGLLAGATVNWSIQQAPAGSTATLGSPTQPFATLTPDLPGDYVVSAQIVKNGVGYAVNTIVHAWQITYPALSNGGIVAGNSAFSLSIEGPSGFLVSVDGSPIAPGGGGTFGPIAVTFDLGQSFSRHVIEITHQDGSRVRSIAAFFLGQGVGLGTGAVKSVLARLNESGLDLASEVVEAGLQSVDLKSAIVGLPAVELVDQPGPFGGTLFSAYADVTNVTYDLPITLSQNAGSSGLVTTLTMLDLKLTVKVTGEIANIPYSVTGLASADPAIFSGTLALGPNGSTLTTTFSGHSVNLANFSFSLPGFPGSSSQLSTIASTLKTYLANQIKNFLASNIAAKVKSMFVTVLPDFGFAPSVGVSLDLSSTFSVVTHSSGAVSFQLNSVCLAPNPKEGAAQLSQFVSNITSPPSIPGTGPLGEVFDFAFATADDYYNAVLAAATRAGFLEGPASVLLQGSGSSISLSAGQLAAAFPGAGFEQFAPETTVRATYHATSGPMARPSPDGNKLLVRCVGVEVVLSVETAYAELPIVSLAIDSDLELELGVDPDATLAVKSIVSDASILVIDTVSQIDPVEIADLYLEAAKAIPATVKAVIESLEPPSFADVGGFIKGIGQAALGVGKEYWTQFCDFLPWS